MEIDDIMTPERVLANLRPNSKKQLLQTLADASAEHTGFSSQAIFESLLEREKLGSTGVGNGVAIPHAKLSDLQKIVGIFARLEKPIPFESIDDQPVDIVFMLLAPEGSGADHLKALARISRLLRNPATLESIRKSKDPDAIYSLLTTVENATAA